MRLAYWQREFERLDLVPGTYDDDAHAQFMEARVKARARAEGKAQIATFLRTLSDQGVRPSERYALARERFGKTGASTPSLKRIEKAVTLRRYRRERWSAGGSDRRCANKRLPRKPSKKKRRQTRTQAACSGSTRSAF